MEIIVEDTEGQEALFFFFVRVLAKVVTLFVCQCPQGQLCGPNPIWKPT